MKTKILAFSLLLIAAAVIGRKEVNAVWTDLTMSSVEPYNAANPAAHEAVVISNGMSDVEFMRIFGEPKGLAGENSKQILLYDDFRVTRYCGAIVNIPETAHRIFEKRSQGSAYEKLKDATRKISAPQELKAVFAKRKAFTVLNSQGEAVTHAALAATGKVTVVEFFSEEARQACELVSAELGRLLHQHEQVELTRIEIGAWNSEIAKTYHVSTVPDIRVLDQYGNLVAQPITRIERVDGCIDLSRVAESVEKAIKR